MEYSANLGIFYHLLGALAAASFYIPIGLIKNWKWEVSWLINGIASWIIMPLLVTFILIPNFMSFFASIPFNVLLKTYIFGALWGIGGLTFGMTLRYLGLSIGYGVAIGLTLVIGTLTPPLLSGELVRLISSKAGAFALLGVAVALIGIAITSKAGLIKEKETGSTTKEFHLKKGLIIAVICGITSSFMAFAIEAGKPIQEAALAAGVDELYKIMPSYVFIMLGGFTTNSIYCLFKAKQNKAVAELMQDRTDFLKNICLASLGGVIWYMQFFFYGWGHVQMEGVGLSFISWTFHMSMLVLCGGVLGFVLREWKGCSRYAIKYQLIGMGVIIGSTMIIGLMAN